jgi:16S rRNA processing protein RimM
MIIVAEILRPHGIKGEVVLRLHTDHPETVTGAEELYLGADTENPLKVETARMHKNRPLMKLESVDSIDRAQELKGEFLYLPEDQLQPLEDGEYFLHDLTGLTLLDSTSKILGTVKWIMETGGPPVLVGTLAPEGSEDPGKEFMVPFSSGTIAEVDLEAGTIRISNLPGLIDEVT